MNYHYLIAGLPDLRAEQTGAPELKELLETLEETLSEADKKLLALLRMRYDNDNLLLLLADGEAELNPLGNLQKQDWTELIRLMEETDKPKDLRLQPYVAEFYMNRSEEAGRAEQQDRLTTLYYDFGLRMGKKNAFVAGWFEFCLNVNNLLVAHICRKHGWELRDHIVGSNALAELLRNAPAGRDLHAGDEFEQADLVAAIAEEPNMLARERKLDALKWQWLEEHTEYRIFSVDRVLAYWLQCELLHRWDGLTMEQGQQIFRNLLADLKQGVKFE